MRGRPAPQRFLGLVGAEGAEFTFDPAIPARVRIERNEPVRHDHERTARDDEVMGAPAPRVAAAEPPMDLGRRVHRRRVHNRHIPLDLHERAFSQFVPE